MTVGLSPQNQTTTTTEPNESSNVCSPNIRVQWNMTLLEAGSPLHFRLTPFATSKKTRWILIWVKYHLWNAGSTPLGSNWYNHCSLIPMIYSLCGMDHPTLHIEYHTSYAPWISVSKPIWYLGLTSIIVRDPSCNTLKSVQIKSIPLGEFTMHKKRRESNSTYLKRHLFALCFWSTVYIPPAKKKKKTSASKASQKNRIVFQRSNVRIWTPSFKKESLPKRTLEKSTFMADVKIRNHFPQLFGINKPGPNMFEDGDMIFFGEKEGRNWGEKHANL